MTNTEAFQKAIEIGENEDPWKFEPIKAFITPIKVIHMYMRILDYLKVNKKKPTSYRTMHQWEKKYYENNM